MCDKPMSVCPCDEYSPLFSNISPGPDGCSKWLCDPQTCQHSDKIVQEAKDAQDLSESWNYCPNCGSCGENSCCPPSMCDTVRCLYGESNVRDYTCTGVQAWAAIEILKQIQELITSGISTDIACNHINDRLTTILPILDTLYVYGPKNDVVRDNLKKVEEAVGKNSTEAQLFSEYVLKQLKS